MSDSSIDSSKRTWLIASGCAGAVGGVATAVPFVSSFSPSEKAKAAGAAVEVDISELKPGEKITAEWRGKPMAIRVDNGPEYVSGKLMEWAEKQGIALSHIQPGKPQQNAYVERYNRTVRHEWLDQHIIESIEEAQEFATQWLWTYNNERPNMGIGGITPAQKLKMAA